MPPTLLVGAIISFFAGLIITVFIHDLLSKRVDKKRQEKECEEIYYEYEGIVFRRKAREFEKATKQDREGELLDLIEEFKPRSSELWFVSLQIGIPITLFICLIFWLISMAY